MDPDKKIELHIPSVPGFEKVAMKCAAEVAQRMGFSEDKVEDLKTAVAEACINAMEHGNRMEPGAKVGITLTLEASSLQVDIRDEGRGVGEVAKPDIDEKMEGKEKTRGWGIFLIKSLMDDVRFEAAPEGGNVVRMLIHLDRADR
jgi:serine/threonine-protein kinase RsbW